MLRVGLKSRGGLKVAICCSLGVFGSGRLSAADPPVPLRSPMSLMDSGLQTAGYEVEDGETIQLTGNSRVSPRTRNGSARAPEALVEAQTVAKGTSADKVRAQAMAALPLDQLTPEARARAEGVLREIGYYRRMPTISFQADPAVYQYFVAYPDVAVSIWRAMEISKLQMWQTGPASFEGDAGDGTIGVVDILYRSNERSLAICEGEYKNPLLQKPIKAQSLVLLETNFSRQQDGTWNVTHRADLFVAFPSQTVETAAKILSPVTGPMVDRNFHEMSLFLRMMTIAMQHRPQWVEGIAARLDGVHQLRRDQLVQLTAQVQATEQQRLQAQQTPRGPVVAPQGVPFQPPAVVTPPADASATRNPRQVRR